jgi:hypothetical protein
MCFSAFYQGKDFAMREHTPYPSLYQLLPVASPFSTPPFISHPAAASLLLQANRNHNKKRPNAGLRL